MMLIPQSSTETLFVSVFINHLKEINPAFSDNDTFVQIFKG